MRSILNIGQPNLDCDVMMCGLHSSSWEDAFLEHDKPPVSRRNCDEYTVEWETASEDRFLKSTKHQLLEVTATNSL